MNQSASRKFRKTFNKNFKQQLEATAEKLCNEKFKRMMEEKDKEVFYYMRRGDIVFLIACGLILSNITFIILWQWNNIKLLFKIFNL